DNAPQQNRNDNLQMLRFFAAAFVLLTHITFYIHERVDNSIEIWHVGEVGVPIFFVISGFVMHLSATRIPLNSEGARIFM
uniref:acyltransferase family protein n=1 Tax=Acinetobacter baumannii TaxID=470 RepID=UPI0011125C03